MISVDAFHKAYDRTVAVNGISFEVRPGEIMGLVGPNGAGKTTTLRAISAILPPTRGCLTVGGANVETHPIEAKRQAAYVPDDPQLFHDLTVAQHLSFFATAYQVSDAERKAGELLEQFEIMFKRDSPARDLSRGMRQKLAICCAYLHDPSAILFDEPLTGLDPHGIRTLKASIRERAERGAAIVVSSHLLAMVEDICTHVFILDRGRQKFCGTIDELRATFADEQEETRLEEIFFRATPNRGVTGAMRIIHPAIGHLIRLQFRARIGRLARHAATPRRLVFTVLATLLGVAWLSQAVVGILYRYRPD